MANINTKRGVIGILTGGGDVPGLNPAIRAVTLRALNEGYKVVGLRRGWGGLLEMVRDKDADNSAHYVDLTEEFVKKAGRTGGTFLHTSRTRPSHVPQSAVPTHLRDSYQGSTNDLTPDVIKNIDYLGIDTLIPIGGDDTLSYGVHLHRQGVKVIAIPKTMDNDVPGTDYCIGFSTCVSRTIALANSLRTSAGSHERFLVIEVFGRYAGFTALLPTLAAAADRCLIPEHPFDFDHLTALLSQDRAENPSRYAIVLVSEGAVPAGGDMVFSNQETDMFGHKKLGGIGDLVAQRLKDLSPKYNRGQKVDVLNQKLGYLVRCGEPDALDSIIPMAFGNIAFDLVLEGKSGRMACLRKGEYDDVPLEVVTSHKKVVDIDTSYDRDRLRPLYSHFSRKPFLLIEGA